MAKSQRPINNKGEVKMITKLQMAKTILAGLYRVPVENIDEDSNKWRGRVEAETKKTKRQLEPVYELALKTIDEQN